ncbi:ankyrin repeat protein [Penicillium malachiteum]|uniref:Ankyrin repeat protein n=1 Tax=Penicillium malachiteum TaxID=1324776 RepID=A0AAD6HH17_9EURO|nr:ankyrin repeat protein [Penicillium malachiteum]
MASNLLSSLPQIRVSLLVGIGSGIARPDQGRDIRLGDIAVSQPQGTSGGVIQYDLGKVNSDNEWEQKGFLGMPPLVLLNALANLQAEHEAGEIRLPEILDSMRKLNKGVNGYSHQGFENDRLFKSSYSHDGAYSCRDCDVEEQIERIPRDTTEPEVHYGVIASGGTLVKDAMTRDTLVERVGEECICFEMKAAGLMNAFPCLVIRGICDYANSHTNDQWQRYASATAAAYGKELLQYVPTHALQSTDTALNILKSSQSQSISISSKRINLIIPKWTRK